MRIVFESESVTETRIPFSFNKNDAKKIICPNTWFNKCDEIKNFVYDDLIPNEWIKIKI